MRKSKPAAMCLKVADVNNWLFPSSPNGEAYSPWASNFQREPDGFDTLARLNEMGNLMAFIPRVDCETDFDYLQLLPYAVVMTHDGRIVGTHHGGLGGIRTHDHEDPEAAAQLWDARQAALARPAEPFTLELPE